MKSNPTSQNGDPQRSTNSKCGWGPGADWTPIQGWWEWTLSTIPRKDSLHMPEYKHSRQLTTVSDVRTWAYIPPNPSFKWPMHPNTHCFTAYNSQGAEWQSALSQADAQGQCGEYSHRTISHERQHWNYAVMPLFAQGWTLEDHTKVYSTDRGRKEHMMFLSVK